MSNAAVTPRCQVALSTASVFPDRTPDAFARLGYDGVEVMVSADAVSQDVDVLRRLVDYHGLPVLAIHAPNLLVTQRVWGREPWGKLVKATEVAGQLGARVIVVHPPFRWQRDYARDFMAGLTRMEDEGSQYADALAEAQELGRSRLGLVISMESIATSNGCGGFPAISPRIVTPATTALCETAE